MTIWIKIIGWMLKGKNVVEAVKKEYDANKFIGVVGSRLVWGPFWVLVGEILSSAFGISIEQATWDSLTDTIINSIPAIVQLWGAFLFVKSLIERVVKALKKKDDGQNGSGTP